ISCCHIIMIVTPNTKGIGFRKDSAMYEVDLLKSDAYGDVVSKISAAQVLDEFDDNSLEDN
uniref:Uncharacterized protein n=1 Tax=Amphimedon queenslandica TaxID=400682 RepID=A0A1X7SRX8_AMPQE